MSELDNIVFNDQCFIIKDVNELYRLKNFKGSFSVLNLNVRSLMSNFYNLISMLEYCNSNVTIMLITETWLTDTVSNL